ncbi:MAG: TetR/AcrR family transcriptional regulator [Bacteroidota bacterium]
MPRSKAFDPDAALDRAVDLFWQRGYEAVSIQDLVDHLGISRSSLYQTFGDKQALWLAALDRYKQQGEGEARLLRESETEPLAALRRYFQAIVDYAAADADYRGCLLANAAVERGPSDAETARRAEAALAGMQQTFEQVIQRAQAAGELPADRAATALGRYLANAVYGLKATARLGPSKAALQDVVDQTLRTLE